MDLILLPIPKRLEVKEHQFQLMNELKIKIPSQDLFSTAQRLKEVILKETKIEASLLIGEGGAIQFVRDDSLNDEAYQLLINEEGVVIRYGQANGAFHAVSTLKQVIVQRGRFLPCLQIDDEPDYSRRGVMLDISRDKVPTMKTLYHLIDMYADLKLNELQLYIEGFSFAYESFPEVWEDQTPVTPEEMMLLDRYCQERFIDFVPNQNSFGHMAPWINRREYADLAVCPDGCLSPWNTFTKNTTLDPQDERSLQLVTKQYDDLLPYFTSTYFNVGMDEPIELGHGKSEEICKEKGEGRVYLDYLLQVYEEVKKRGKTMQFWGDIIIKFPELIKELPKDVIALEWGYEGNHPFQRRLKEYKNAGITFYVCPGTSSWNSVIGRTNNMRDNHVNAAVYGREYGAIGYLNTDWGDNGHVQYLPVSYPSFCLGAALSWGTENNKDVDVTPYLNTMIFKDPSGETGRLLWEIGNFYELESVKLDNTTKLFQGFKQDITNTEKFIAKLQVEDYLKLEAFLNESLDRLNRLQLTTEEAILIKKEMKNGLQYVLHGTKRILYMLNYYEDRTAILYELKNEIESVMKNHYELWTSRNRLGGLEDSLSEMRRQRDEYKRLLEAIDAQSKK